MPDMLQLTRTLRLPELPSGGLDADLVLLRCHSAHKHCSASRFAACAGLAEAFCRFRNTYSRAMLASRSATATLAVMPAITVTRKCAGSDPAARHGDPTPQVTAS